jgi:hypothetical protein
MSRPQVSIDRLTPRRATVEPREAMNCKSCRKRKVRYSHLHPRGIPPFPGLNPSGITHCLFSRLNATAYVPVARPVRSSNARVSMVSACNPRQCRRLFWPLFRALSPSHGSPKRLTGPTLPSRCDSQKARPKNGCPRGPFKTCRWSGKETPG